MHEAVRFDAIKKELSFENNKNHAFELKWYLLVIKYKVNYEVTEGDELNYNPL